MASSPGWSIQYLKPSRASAGLAPGARRQRPAGRRCHRCSRPTASKSAQSYASPSIGSAGRQMPRAPTVALRVEGMAGQRASAPGRAGGVCSSNSRRQWPGPPPVGSRAGRAAPRPERAPEDRASRLVVDARGRASLSPRARASTPTRARRPSAPSPAAVGRRPGRRTGRCRRRAARDRGGSPTVTRRPRRPARSARPSVAPPTDRRRRSRAAARRPRRRIRRRPGEGMTTRTGSPSTRSADDMPALAERHLPGASTTGWSRRAAAPAPRADRLHVGERVGLQRPARRRRRPRTGRCWPPRGALLGLVDLQHGGRDGVAVLGGEAERAPVDAARRPVCTPLPGALVGARRQRARPS